MTLSTWNETFDVLYECLDISWLAPPLHIVDPKVISLLFSFRFHLDGFKMDKSLSQYTIGVYFTLQLMPCLWLVYSLEWITSSAEIQEREKKRKSRKKSLYDITIFPVQPFPLYFYYCSPFNYYGHALFRRFGPVFVPTRIQARKLLWFSECMCLSGNEFYS